MYQLCFLLLKKTWMEEQERRNVNCRHNTGYQQLALKAVRDDVFKVNLGLRLKGRS